MDDLHEKERVKNEYISNLISLYDNSGVKILPSLPLDDKINNLHVNFPTSGFVVLVYLKNLKGIKKFDYYGFGFQEKSTFEENVLNRCFMNYPKDTYSGHNFFQEAMILEKLFNN